MEAQRFDFSASQVDWDFGDGTDNASQPEIPPTPSDQSDRSPKRRRLSKGSGKGGDGKMCAVCEVEPCVVKFNYCKECKKDIQSCLNNAKADGKEDDFKRLSKTSAGLKHLIAHYKSKCPSRGQGVPRDKMDWVSYLSSVFTENRQVNGEKEVFMDFPDFEQFCKSKGKTAKDALEEWSDMEAQGRDHDFKGRKDFEKRFAVVTEEYRLKEKVNGDRQDTQSCTKQKKINSKEGAELMRAFDKPSDDKNGSTGSGQASSPGCSSTRPAETESVLDSEHAPAAPKPSRQKDVVRARATHFDKNQKLLKTLVSEHAAALAASAEVAQKHESEKAELKHFFDILTVREKLLDILANKTAEELKTFLDTESKESISCQPVPEPQLRTCLVAADLDPLVKKVLLEETNEGLENNCTEVKNLIAIHSQVRNAVKTSTRDIDNAVKSKVKRKEAAAKKAAKDKEREQKAQAAAAAKAKASAVSPGSGAQPTLLKVDIQKFKATVQTFTNFVDFGKANISGEQPFLITNFCILQDFLKDNVTLKCQLVNFGNQFLGTQICKQTGRAQCPIMGDDAQEKVGAFFDKVTGSFHLPLPASGAEAESKVLKPLLHSALFGFSADMEYAGIEDKALGQLRFVHSGVRKVCMIKITDFMQLMAQPPSNMGELIQAWKFLRFEDLEKKENADKADKIIPAVQTPGSLLYVPPAWLVAEKVENGSSLVGLRRSLMVKSGTEEIEQMIKLLDNKHPLQDIARAQLAFWNQQQKKSA